MNSNSKSRRDATQKNTLKHRIHEIIFEADTKMGLLFDVILLAAIVCSVTVVCLESVESLEDRFQGLFLKLEWFFTGLFTVEYILRLYCVKRPLRYAISFFGLIDLLAVMPMYVGLLFVQAPSFAVIRAFRLLRIFRIFKLLVFLKEAEELGRAIASAWGKVVVFIGVVVISITVSGTLMYEIENWGYDSRMQSEAPTQERLSELRDRIRVYIDQDDFENAQSALGELQGASRHFKKSKFSSIPESMYWATVTMTTVGYGDIVPTTTLGKFVAAVLILLGYSLIIVPTGFVSAEFIGAKKAPSLSTQTCPYCMLEGHDMHAEFCRQCGNPINEDEADDSSSVPAS